jgi:ATP-dependent RNA helicase MSS116
LKWFQYGAPYSEELYLHRLGRTGRAGQVGNGLLVLLPFETRLLSKYRKYNIVENTAEYNLSPEANPDLKTVIEAIQSAVRGRHSVLAPSAELACTSFIAHYLEYSRSNTKGSTVTNILIAAEHLAQSFGLSSLPELPINIQSKIITKKEL